MDNIYFNFYPQTVEGMDESISYKPLSETGPDWLKAHAETFVAPYLGKAPEIKPEDSSWAFFHPKMVLFLKIALDKALKVANEQGRPLLLAGRDVWAFEVLARLQGLPTIFRPEFSGNVVRDKGWGDILKTQYSHCYLLDTGYTGSVPLALGIPEGQFALMHCSTSLYQPKRQLFPLVTNNRLGSPYASNLEGMCKYWTSGTTKRNMLGQLTIEQSLSEKEYQFPNSWKATYIIAKTFLDARWRGSLKDSYMSGGYRVTEDERADYSWFPKEGEVEPPKVHERFKLFGSSAELKKCGCYGCVRKRERTKVPPKLPVRDKMGRYATQPIPTGFTLDSETQFSVLMTRSTAPNTGSTCTCVFCQPSQIYKSAGVK